LAQLEKGVNAETFLLGCTPAVNLFERQADPIPITETDTEYRVVADTFNETSTEIYSIERVISSRPDSDEIIQYEPFYSFRHNYGGDTTQPTFWIANRRDSFRKDDKGTEVYLSLVDLGFRPTVPPTELLTLRVKCTNRDLPAKLPIVGVEGEFDMASGPMVRVRCRHRPTQTLRPEFRRGLQWRLISHLALNGLSIVEGREAFQELLKLYDFSDDPAVRRQIEGITSVSSKPHVARVTTENGIVMCTGMRVDMEFDEDQFVGGSAFLMAAVIERFLGLYSSTNSFSQLFARSRQRKGLLKQWPPRAGDQTLL
jgi:type VI secretion system protein ImpG